MSAATKKAGHGVRHPVSSELVLELDAVTAMRRSRGQAWRVGRVLNESDRRSLGEGAITILACLHSIAFGVTTVGRVGWPMQVSGRCNLIRLMRRAMI
jgi:hypothetical protein